MRVLALRLRELKNSTTCAIRNAVAFTYMEIVCIIRNAVALRTWGLYALLEML